MQDDYTYSGHGIRKWVETNLWYLIPAGILSVAAVLVGLVVAGPWGALIGGVLTLAGNLLARPGVVEWRERIQIRKEPSRHADQ